MHDARVTKRFQSIAPDVVLCEGATVHEFVNLYGCTVGDGCNVSYNGTTSTSPFGADGFVTAVSGSNVSATVTFWNGANGPISLTPTSSATGVSSTLKATCFHTGV